MTRFVMRGGRPVSIERAAILDGLAPGETPQPIARPEEPDQQSLPPRNRSERLVAAVERGAVLSPQQKRAITMAANKAAREAAAAEPLRPTNIDPETGQTVILKEVIEDGEVKQVRVDEATIGEDETIDAAQAEDPFDAAVEAAAGEAGDADAEAALADAD